MEEIDILITLYRNYQFIRPQLRLFRKLFTNYNIIICDSTPIEARESIDDLDVDKFFVEKSGLDVEIHGYCLDLLVRRASSPIVGICDSDFFWLKPGLLDDIRDGFSRGLKCIGAAGWYPDWQRTYDLTWKNRAGHMAPVCWGMFVDRELALEQTFVTTEKEAHEVRETGWRLRQKLIQEDIPREVYPGFKYPKQQDPEICYFGSPEKPLAVHFLRGSGRRMEHSSSFSEAIRRGKRRWRQ